MKTLILIGLGFKKEELKMKKIKKILSYLLVVSFASTILASCDLGSDIVKPSATDSNYDEIFDVDDKKTEVEDGQFNEGVVLVKTKSFDKSKLGSLSYTDYSPLYKNSEWYKIQLSSDTKSHDALTYLSNLRTFDKVSLDYIMDSDGEVVDVSSNPYSVDQTYLETQGIKEAWNSEKNQGLNPGGSSDVIVAVIDTGVDYNHIDLRDNIWVNTGEIPNNGIDDDGNGYVDDYYGWNCVGDNNDPMDDNGHGTHVAGIIAAENNDVGTVGVAYNSKIMCIKAGNSSGYFNNSDIAEAIQYAYMNGASVINMSFGGSNISLAVEDALENAYNQCVLVAAAGNSGLCNNLNHKLIHSVGVSYPGALPYVIGVMSTNSSGTMMSSFSNYDDTPYNSVEYEVFACGEQIPSTWPNNKIAKLSGTSMASPVVAGIAALLRSKYTDRDVYSNKYIQSQIVNTGKVTPYNPIIQSYDLYHTLVDATNALDNIPEPNVYLYDYYIFDNKEFSNSNNEDGVIEAGETIRLAVELINLGGVATDVNVTVDTIRHGDSSITDPYFTIVNDSIKLSDIGTYSVRDCEKLYKDGVLVGTSLYFEIQVSNSCPNDYLTDFNIHFTYRNGLDKNDTTLYTGSGTATLSVSNGYILPSNISVDTTYTADKLYIIPNSVTIPEGVTVNFEAGCKIQFYAASESYYGSTGPYNSPKIDVYGTLNFNGTQDNKIEMYPSERYSTYGYYICNREASKDNWGNTLLNNVNCINLIPSINGLQGYNECKYGVQFFSSELKQNNMDDGESFHIFKIGKDTLPPTFCFSKIIDSKVNFNSVGNDIYCDFLQSSLVFSKTQGCVMAFNDASSNVFYTSYRELKHWSTSGNNTISLKSAQNNLFITLYDNNVKDCYIIKFSNKSEVENNEFVNSYKSYGSSVIENYIDSTGNPIVDLNGKCSDYSLLYPFIKDVQLLDKDDQEISKVGIEEFSMKITFSRPMDTSYKPNVYFGSRTPFADYQITGDYISDTVWEGKYIVKAFIENGTQSLRITNAYAKDEDGYLKELVDHASSFHFDIDTTAALSMNLQATSSEDGVNLAWMQDDYDTLMGYNVYRSEEKDGNYTKLNTSVIPSNENTFLDDNAEPGKTYWYTFTVVFSDMTESSPAGKISCTCLDTIAPSIYHTPINQGYLNNNLVIACTASDNVAVSSVTLNYRTKGETSWKKLAMAKQNDRYSATIFGSELSLDGLEYYIVASDGVNTISKGSEDDPYSVVIKDASSISKLGDVDGDGLITTKDALMILKSINGDLLLTDDQFKRADLNTDGVLSTSEALRILQYINGKVSTLAM